MKNLLILLSISISGLLFAQTRVVGNGQVITETRTVNKSFNGVKTAGSFDLIINDGPQDGKIQLNGESNIIENMDVSIQDGILVLMYKRNLSLSINKSVKVTLNAQNLKSIELIGSGDVTTKGTQKSDDLQISVKGSGDVIAKVDTKKLSTSISGSGDITLSGKTNQLSATNKGSGDLKAYELVAGDVNLQKTGSGDSKITCNGNLTINSMGSGDVLYRGNPTDIISNKRGSGSVKKVN